MKDHFLFWLAGAALLIFAVPAFGQMSAAEHASHHAAPAAGSPMSPMASPATQNAQPAVSASPATPTGGETAPGPAGASGAGGMGEMMKGMGTAPTKELYPTLMALPDGMTPEDRDQVARLSQQRTKEGADSLSSGLEKLSAATVKQDYAAMQKATEQMHEGLADFETGIAGQRVISEGKAPRNVALDWFRRDMNLASPIPDEEPHTFFGMTPIHLFTMVLLIAFALAMLAMYFFKMRRATALFGRIDPDKKPAPPAPPRPADGPEPPKPPTLGGTPAPGPPKPPQPETPTPGNPAAEEPPKPSEPKPPPPEGPSTAPVPAGDAANPADNTPAPPATRDPPASPIPPPPVSELAAASPVTAKWQGQLRLANIVTETPSVKTFRLLPPSPNDPFLPFTFLPGQFLNVAFWIGGAKMNRSYSISSSPNEREYVELSIRREPRGAVSRHIDDLLRVGDRIDVDGPVGKFTFTGAEADSIVLLSAGVGITPMMSICRFLTERSWPGDIFFIYTCRTPSDFIFADKLPELQRRNPKLHVAVTVSKPEGTDWKGARGRITKEWLTRTVPDLASRMTHLCGPPAMMDSMKAIFNELGIAPEHLKTEAFGAVKPAPAAPGTAKPKGPATGPLVTFSKNNKSAKIRLDLRTGDSPPKQSILELSEELSIGIEFSCRVGTCGVCKTKMTSGEVDQEVQDALDADDKAKNIILACQAKPKGDVTVEA